MLKLERIAKSGEIIMQFQGRTPVFSTLFYRALGLSLLIHFLALFVFNIQPFILGPTTVFPPIMVQTPQPLSADLAVLEAVDDNLALDVQELFPGAMLLAFPAMPLALIDRPVLPNGLFPFSVQNPDEPTFPVTHSSSMVTGSYEPITIEISGRLASRQLISTSWKRPEKQMLAQGKVLNSYSVIYLVRVDERTGRIFWYEKMASSGDLFIDSEAELIMLGLKFVSIPDSIDTEGQIRFIFSRPSNG